MVDMGVGENDAVKLLRCEGKRLAIKRLRRPRQPISMQEPVTVWAAP
jgi:hypothetical protein